VEIDKSCAPCAVGRVHQIILTACLGAFGKIAHYAHYLFELAIDCRHHLLSFVPPLAVVWLGCRPVSFADKIKKFFDLRWRQENPILDGFPFQLGDSEVATCHVKASQPIVIPLVALDLFAVSSSGIINCHLILLPLSGCSIG